MAFSFGLRAEQHEPGPCNRRLAAAVERIVRTRSEPVVLVAQWEVARGLTTVTPDQVVGPAESAYLDSNQVWEAAAGTFRRHRVRAVVPVANPLLHRTKTARLIRQDGFTVVNEPIGWVGFDPSPLNRQWWTAGPLRLCFYALSQALTGRRGR